MAAALLVRVLSALPGSRHVLRCSPACTVEKWFSKQISSDNCPKYPLTAYIRFYKEYQPLYRKQNPDISILDVTRMVANAWRELPASDKQPYEAAAKVDRQVYKEQMAKYKAQLTPAQEAALKEEKRRKREKRRVSRKKRQLTMLGKPKRPRNPFNIFVAEHFQESKGISTQGRLKNLFEEWQKTSSSQKQTYQQLAEDDRIRYENEMKSWEEHMIEIGREDLVRHKIRRRIPKRKKTAKNVASKKSATALKTPSGSKAASQATEEKTVKARQSEE
ncbi:transcription factor A, mitochondrial [Rhineura floridana]|uniref:transcription factor A, mitochondrial n=1 Tax=Rhineura floridana TaxID=261503 RepID=UPI002AC807D4|nr:transcription factor A, mitochondrial [Rhineura floridana]